MTDRWPSFVYDPRRLPSTCDKAVKDKAKKHFADGKKYVVYFYADHSYGFVGTIVVNTYFLPIIFAEVHSHTITFFSLRPETNTTLQC
jgi:hypothetical protein